MPACHLFSIPQLRASCLHFVSGSPAAAPSGIWVPDVQLATSPVKIFLAAPGAV